MRTASGGSMASRDRHYRRTAAGQVSHKEEELDFTGTFNIAEVRAQLEAMEKQKQKQKSSST